jgi:DNA-binding LytR/AlgR family response regulator
MKLTCAIVDDEFLARQYLKDYIKKLPFLELIGDYDSPLMILEELKRNAIDILFLDIQMPDISGLDFLKTLNPQPYVILTTAYKEYALEGYEHNVIDYLLKPFSFDRFLKAVNKAIDRINKERAVFSSIKKPMEITPAISEYHFMTIRADRKWYKINFDDLIFIAGQKAYVTFHTRTKNITALKSLKELEETLPPEKFIRIHKSFIVSIRHVETLEGNLISIGGQKLSIGSNYREKVKGLLKIQPSEEDKINDDPNLNESYVGLEPS